MTFQVLIVVSLKMRVCCHVTLYGRKQHYDHRGLEYSYRFTSWYRAISGLQIRLNPDALHGPLLLDMSPASVLRTVVITFKGNLQLNHPVLGKINPNTGQDRS